MAKTTPKARAARLDRFQTPMAGMTFVATAVDAHFDPYAEPVTRPQLSSAEMERVARVKIG